MSLAILFYFLCAQHVSDFNIRSLRLCCWITTLVVVGMRISVDQRKYAYQLQQSDKGRHTKHTTLNTINLH